MPSHCDRVIVARDNDDTDNGEDDSDLRRELLEQHAGNECQRPGRSRSQAGVSETWDCVLCSAGSVYFLQVLCSVLFVLTVVFM